MNIQKYVWQDSIIEFRLDGYVNATEMAKSFDRQPYDFIRLPKVVEYLDALESATGLSRSTLVITNVGNSSSIQQGTWFHPKLAIRFAQWLDQRFAVWVDARIEELLTTGRTELKKKDPAVVMAEGILAAQEIIENLKKRIESEAHKVKSYNTFLTAGNNLTMNQAAKALNDSGIIIGRNRLFDFLREKKVFLSDNTPYQNHIDARRFKVIIKPIQMGDQILNKPQTFVTPKGMDYIRALLEEHWPGIPAMIDKQMKEQNNAAY
jgi:phage antirepressor YoqD-like protein